MDLVFDPPHGVAPLRLGMTLQEAVAAAPREWGQASVLRRSEDDAMAEWTLDHVGVQAMAEEDGVVVTAIELWWPGEGRVFSTRVLLDGDEVFTTPAQEVFARAVSRGWRVGTSQPEYPVIPGVSLGFTRQTSQEVERDADRLPRCVTSVLVGAKDYYDYRYE
ncbi:hypothetical protein ACFC96_42740 [Streptomyces sp. NPDC055955]|uniref:hypothetical protein n=1 Tax=Streptomyces sp. NPDC055955 TaxID=3345665 RepID=UPI0035D7B571